MARSCKLTNCSLKAVFRGYKQDQIVPKNQTVDLAASSSDADTVVTVFPIEW